MKAPQIIMLVFIGINLVMGLVKLGGRGESDIVNGENRRIINLTVFATAIFLIVMHAAFIGLLYWGGFFR